MTLIARRLRHQEPAALAWWQCAVGAVALLWWPLLDGWPQQMAAWGWLAGLGLLHTALAYTLIYAGMARLQAPRVAVLQFVYPGAALMVDWLWLARPLGWVQWCGVVLLCSAIWLAEHASERPARRPQGRC